MPVADELATWLPERMPDSPAPTLVHNDWRLDNMAVHPEDPGTVRRRLRLGYDDSGRSHGRLGYAAGRLVPSRRDPLGAQPHADHGPGVHRP